MPIKPAKVPEESVAELRRSMSGDVNRGDRFSMGGAEALGGAPVLRFAHEAYALTPEQILRSGSPEEAEARSWRYVIAGPEGASIAEVAEVRGETGPAHVFSEASKGLHSQLSEEALRWVHEQAELGEDTFEVRGLRVPAVLVDALWLKNETHPGGDLYTVVRPLKELLVPRRLYSTNEFFDALREAIRQVPVFDNAPQSW